MNARPSPIGTLTANSQGQCATDRMPDATVGPTAEAIEPIVALSPDAAADPSGADR